MSARSRAGRAIPKKRMAILHTLAVASLIGVGASGGPACRSPIPFVDERDATTEDSLTTRLDGFLVRQRIAYQAGERRGSFEAVVQLRCGELTIIGLAPFGARAFTIRDGAAGTSIDTHVPMEWPFPPMFILSDVQRTYLIPDPDTAPADGTREARWRNERVVETWRHGRLLQRHFETDASAEQPVDSLFEYPDGLALGELPSRVNIASRRFAYRLEVTTLSRTPVACAR
jgi:hypothetical protein